MTTLPGLGFLLCGVPLRGAETRFLLFPAYTYFAGTLAAGFFSISEGLVATAYVWLVFYLLLFGRLSTWKTILILTMSLGTLHLHEEMSFLGPLLLVSGCLRWRDAKSAPARVFLVLALAAFFAGAIIGAYRILFPTSPSEAAGFIYQVEHLQWIYMRGVGCNLPAALGLLAGGVAIGCIAMPGISRTAVLAFGITAVALAVAAFWIDALTVPEAQFFARGNSAFLSIPEMMLALTARFMPVASKRLTGQPIQAIVVILGAAVSLWHIQATVKWSDYILHVRTVLASNVGIIPMESLLQPPGTRPAKLATMMKWPWTYPDLSILVLPRPCMTSIIANPPGGGPYDLQRPSTLPRIPGLTYAYLPAGQSATCAAQ